MNKKVLSAILFSALFAGTGTFTSCIDTDEPEGIENLRGAKAELIRAKVAVEAANAAYLQAEAALKLAEAETEKADARYRNAEAEWQEAMAEAQKITNEEQRALLEQKIAKIQLEMQETALQLQASIVKKQQTLAENQRAYEVALQQIAIAEAVGSDFEKASIASLKSDVENAYKKIYDPKGLADKVYEAEKALYEAMLTKNAGFKFGQDGKIDLNDNQSMFIPGLELELARAEADVVEAKEALAKLEGFLENDAETTDWRAEIAELEEEIEALKNEISEYDVKIEKAENSEEALAAKQALYGVTNDGALVKKGTKQELLAALKAYNALVDKASVKLALSGHKVEINKALTGYISAAITDLNTEAAKSGKTFSVAGFDATANTFTVEKVADYNYVKYAYTEGTGTEAGTVVGDTYALGKFAATASPEKEKAAVANMLKAIDEATIDENELVNFEKELAKLEKALNDTVTGEIALYEKAEAEWQAMIDAIEDPTAAPKAPTTKLDAAVTAYNTAVGNLNTAIANYNANFASIYETDSVASLQKIYDEVYFTGKFNGGNVGTGLWFKDAVLAEYDAAVQAATGITNASDRIKSYITLNTTTVDGVAVIDYATVITAVEGLFTAKAGATEAQVKTVADALAAAKLNPTAQLAAFKIAKAKDIETAAGLIGQASVTKDLNKTNDKGESTSTIKAKAKAIADAKTAVETKYSELATALTAYRTEAETKYAQLPITEGDNKTPENYAAATGVTSTVAATTWYTSAKAIAALNVESSYTAVRTAVSAENAAKVASTEFSVDKAEAALEVLSKNAFGEYWASTPRYTIPSKDKVRAEAEAQNKKLADYGALGALIAAEDKIQEQKDQVNAADLLAELKEEVTAIQTTLLAEIAANDAVFANAKAAVAAADAANVAAKAAYKAATDAVTLPLQIEQGKLEAKKQALGDVKDELVGAVEDHLHIDLTKEDGTADNADYDKFEDQLKASVKYAENQVIVAEKAVAEAEMNLQLAKDNKYDVVAAAQRKLDAANAALEKAMAEYEAALVALEKGLAVIAGEESAE